MQLKSLRIELETYGENKGKYETTITYTDPKGEIKLVLSPELSNALLPVVANSLNRFALNGMAELEQAIRTSIEQAKNLGI